MERPVWSGVIAFGLVSIPVKMFTATSTTSLDLDMLDKKDHNRIRYKRVNDVTGKEVPWNNIVKGYDLEGQYVVLTDEDFDRAAAAKTKRIDILSFCDAREVDTIYYENAYFLVPEAQHSKPYVLLRQALEKTGMVALGTYVMRNKEHLCIVKVYDNALVLSKIHFEQELRSPGDFKIPADQKASAAELKMAVSLIQSMAGPFDISAYKDEYTAQLMQFIKDKAKGKKVPKTAKAQKLPSEVRTLMDQLKASIEASGAAKKTKRKTTVAPATKPKTRARTTRTRTKS